MSGNLDSKDQEIEARKLLKSAFKADNVDLSALIETFTKNLAEILQQEKKVIAIINQKGWGAYMTSFAITNKEYEKLYQDKINIINKKQKLLDEFTAQANKTFTEKFLSAKQEILATYNTDFAYIKADNSIDEDKLTKESTHITPENIAIWQQNAKKAFNNIAGSYILPDNDSLKVEFIQKLFLIEEKLARAANISLLKESQEIIKKKTIALQQELIKEIDAAILKAADKQPAPPKPQQTGSTWFTSLKDKAIVAAYQKFEKIAGINKLSYDQRNLFINHLCILEEKKQPTTTCENEIKQAIHSNIANNPDTQKTIEEFKESFNTIAITNLQLRHELEQQLADVIINKKKYSMNIPALENTPEDLGKVINIIQIAKILDPLTAFKELAIEDQLTYLYLLNTHLATITNGGKDPNITNNQEQEIKKIIDNIVLHKVNKSGEELGVNGWTDWTSSGITKTWSEIKAFAKNPRIQGAAITSTIAVTTALSQGIAAPAAIAATATIGAMAGAAVPETRHIFAPMKAIRYLKKEISDIINKPKSYVDRGFRVGSMLGASALAGTAIYFIAVPLIIAAAANPFSGPVIAGAVLAAGLVVATPIIIAAAAKTANWISKKTSKFIYGYEDVDLYKPTDKAIACLESKEQADIVSKYFAKNIQALINKLNNLPDQKNSEAILLQDKINLFKNAWNKIQQYGDPSLWKQVATESIKEQQQQGNNAIGPINTKDITYSLIETITTPKYEETDKLNPLVTQGPQRKNISFENHNKQYEKITKATKEHDEIKNILGFTSKKQK